MTTFPETNILQMSFDQMAIALDQRDAFRRALDFTARESDFLRGLVVDERRAANVRFVQGVAVGVGLATVAVGVCLHVSHASRSR